MQGAAGHAGSSKQAGHWVNSMFVTTTNKNAGAARRIVALKGASSEIIQRLLADFAASLADHGVQVAGVVEVTKKEARGACRSLGLRDLSSGQIIAISQNLGSGSISCNLDAAGLAEACAAIERAIATGAEVVVLSKFGKQEAARAGLADAFRAAVSAQLPIVTAVSPALADAWGAFAGPLSEFIEARAAALDAWWSTVSRDTLMAAAE